MGTSPESTPTLFGKSRWAVLSLLYGRPDQSFYLRQIVRSFGLGQGGIQRELRTLVKMGVICRRTEGNQVYFQANPDCPIFAELKSIVVKTVGIADVLRDALAPIASRISLAFLFGSVARLEQTSSSDVDLMVIGSASFADVTKAIRAAEAMIGREINPVVYPVEEFKAKAAKRTSFLSEIFSSPKIFVIGDDIELTAMVGKQVAG
jgi:predicted nucleotidyltransferase